MGEESRSLAPLVASGATAVYNRIADPLSFCTSMAKTFAASTGVPLEQGEAVALTCLCEGLTPIDYRRRYHTIDGKPTMRADAMLAEFRLNHGGSYRIVERTSDRAAVLLTDRDGVETSCSLSWDEAQESRWPWRDWRLPAEKRQLKDNWATPLDRKAMLWARCVSDGLRAVCPELVAGVYTPEEMQDVLDAEYRIVSSAPAKTASDMIAEVRAAASQPERVEAPLIVDEPTDVVIDEADSDPAPALGAASDTTEAPKTVSSDPSAPGSCTEGQREELRSLVEELAISAEQQQAILAKRNCRSSRSLSKDQADEILDKLRAKARQQRAAASGN